mgnify:CR=1 FL=1
MLVHPRKQRGARWATARGIVKLREPQPVCRQLIERGRLDFTAVTADIREPHVISHNNDDVWLLGRMGLRAY